MTPTEEEACKLAQNLARNCGWHVFPCTDDKVPTCKWGTEATNDPDAIAALWNRAPGPLVAIKCGPASNVVVLDLDTTRHPQAEAWWQRYQTKLGPTRTYRTRSGGLHLYYIWSAGVRNCEARPVRGVDTRGEGGCVIFWYASGFECVDCTPPQPWPAWLSLTLWPPAAPPAQLARHPAKYSCDNEKAVGALLNIVKSAPEGNRNSALHWTACRFADRIKAGQIRKGEAERLLLDACANWPNPKKSASTIASGLRGAK